MNTNQRSRAVLLVFSECMANIRLWIVKYIYVGQKALYINSKLYATSTLQSIHIGQGCYPLVAMEFREYCRSKTKQIEGWD